ncbi:hypothetical protein FH972_017374 [Carpinus fangiana]|uniref:Uncharacterized protein n=1 Tax=Carpinus fangiana TaxID=176857 RepID=A0A5N6RM95_9ROSI|nr:hypothetical protein FH972_017374 [Carpinus fangiana]
MVLISENITENDMAAEQTLVPLATERQEEYDLEGGQQDFITPDSKMDGVKMSPTNENNSQNSTELENVTTGWEIQPYVEDPMKHFCRQSFNIQLISKVLKQLVTQSTSQLKQVSAWETKHGKTSVEISVSFKLPEDCAIDIAEVDKIIRPQVPQDGDLNNVNTQNVPQFSFSERLNGWNIERRLRSNGKSCDMVI